MKFTNIKKEVLEKDHLISLRELGRCIGVKTPAGKNKDVLIKEILMIYNGELEPAEKNKTGAPPKIKVDLSKYLLSDDQINYGGAEKPSPTVFHDSK